MLYPSFIDAEYGLNNEENDDKEVGHDASQFSDGEL